MTNTREPNRISAALRYLKTQGEFFEFDNQERVVKVGIGSSTDGDEIAAHIGHLVDLQSLTFYSNRSDLTDEGLRHLARLVNLRDLSLHGSRITADGLACLEAMSQLNDLLYQDRSRPRPARLSADRPRSQAYRNWRYATGVSAMPTSLRWRP